ncbi:hypothetical protein Bbelb_024390 [Branchiostoma belcheri]|nr:hypothetical protein Bbelb_024390 [Branchiostoma belcheri]
MLVDDAVMVLKWSRGVTGGRRPGFRAALCRPPPPDTALTSKETATLTETNVGPWKGLDRRLSETARGNRTIGSAHCNRLKSTHSGNRCNRSNRRPSFRDNICFPAGGCEISPAQESDKHLISQ